MFQKHIYTLLVNNQRFCSFAGIRSRMLMFCIFINTSLFAQADTTLQLSAITIKETAFVKKIDSTSKSLFETQNLTELLQLEAGVYLKNYGNGQLSTPAIRGASAAQTTVLWNGIPLQSSTLGQTDFSLMPLYFSDAVGVDANVGSSTWSAIGGAVEVDNQFRFQQPLKLSLQTAMGSFGSFFQGAKVGFGNQKWASSTRVFYKKADNDFFYKNLQGERKRLPHANLQQYGLLQENQFKINSRQQIGVRFWWQNSLREIPPTLASPVSMATQDDFSSRLMLDWQHSGNAQIWKIKSAWLDETLVFQDGESGLYSKTRTLSNYNKVENDWQIAPQHQLKTGVDHAHLQAFSDGIGENKTQNRLAFYGQYHWRNVSEKTNLKLGVRQAWADGDRLPFLPHFAFSQLFFSTIMVHVNFARAYRLPTFNDLYWQPSGNPNLLPESGWTQELGLKAHHQNWSVSANFFNRNINNWIIWLPAVPEWTPINLEQVWSRGAELEAAFQQKMGSWTGSLKGNYSLTYSTREDDSRVNGKQLIYVPRHQAKGQFRLAYEDFYFTFYSIITGRVFTLRDNSESLPAFFLSDLSLQKGFQWKALKGRMTFRMNNIFNKEYVVVAARPMAGRSVELGLKVDF